MSEPNKIGPSVGRNAIVERLASVTDIDGLKALVAELARGVQFTGETKAVGDAHPIRLSSDLGPGNSSYKQDMTIIKPSTDTGAGVTGINVYTNPTSPAVGQVVTGGTINQPIIMPGAGTPGSGTSVPTITPALRGFPNYKFQPETDGAGLNASLANPAYGPTINQQGLVLQVQVGDTVKYAHIALHDTPDVGVPRPLIGVVGAGTQTPQVPNWSSSTAYVSGNRVVVGGVIYSCILANTNHTPPNGTYWVLVPAATLTNEMIANVNATALAVQGVIENHNDLVQSVLTMGLLPSVPRVKDTVDYSQTHVGPS